MTDQHDDATPPPFPGAAPPRNRRITPPSGGTSETGLIKMSRPVYAELTRIRRLLIDELGRNVTYSETVERLLARAPQPEQEGENVQSQG